MADPDARLNPWRPITDPVDLKHLGKLCEELGEAVAAVSRCIIQGVGERQPVTDVVNRDWLEQELADVQANVELCVERFKLDTERMRYRAELKKTRLREWHKMKAYEHDEDSCPNHVASSDDPKVCGRCGVHVDSLRP